MVKEIWVCRVLAHIRRRFIVNLLASSPYNQPFTSTTSSSQSQHDVLQFSVVSAAAASATR